jgi:hypothetical protein
LALCAGATLAVASGANAFCLYHGVDNAKTTLAQEFRDAKWVVRARAISGDYHWANAGDLWTLYHLTIIRSYKGRAPVHLALFTWRDSGGFYLDGKEAAPDFDHDYLLFLTPAIRRRGDPLAMRGAMWVNYECGQSRPWSRVSRADAVRLQAMSRRMPIAAGK